MRRSGTTKKPAAAAAAGTANGASSAATAAAAAEPSTGAGATSSSSSRRNGGNTLLSDALAGLAAAGKLTMSPPPVGGGGGGGGGGSPQQLQQRQSPATSPSPGQRRRKKGDIPATAAEGGNETKLVHPLAAGAAAASTADAAVVAGGDGAGAPGTKPHPSPPRPALKRLPASPPPSPSHPPSAAAAPPPMTSGPAPAPTSQPKREESLTVNTSGEGEGDPEMQIETSHRRNVSWDFGDGAAAAAATAAAATVGADITPGGEQQQQQQQQQRRQKRPMPVASVRVSRGSQHSREPSGISMRSLLQHTPAESEVETYLQSALDDMDPTVGAAAAHQNRHRHQHTLLGGVPAEVFSEDQDERSDHDDREDREDDETRSLVASAGGPAGGGGALPLYRPTKQGKVVSTAEELFELNNDMKKLHDEDASNVLASGVKRMSQEDGAVVSDADALAENAMALADRQRKTSGREREADDEYSASQSASAAVQALMSEGEGRGDGPKQPERPSILPEEEDGSNTKLASLARQRRKVKVQAISSYKQFEDWLRFEKAGLGSLIKIALLASIIPATGIASLLFYAFDNPPCQRGFCVVEVETNVTFVRVVISASASWWMLFVFVRQVITLLLARATMLLLVDFFALRTRAFVKVFGPLFTLFIVQSKGWPLTLFLWGIYAFAMLYGGHPFADHWLYWQNAIEMMSARNPAGTVTESGGYAAVLGIAVVVGFLVCVKRCSLGLALGIRTYNRYGEELAKIMKQTILVGQVASLAQDIEFSKLNLSEITHINTSIIDSEEGESLGEASTKAGILGGIDMSSRRAEINELLGEWEEPEEASPRVANASIGAIIQFRQSLSFLSSSVPFSAAFGTATTRGECIVCSEAVYNRLMIGIPKAAVLTFDIIALLAIRKDGSLDEQKLKALIRLFRPDRDGNLSLLDFAKSVDSVYKELRLLRAAVLNSSKLDKACENLINILFYFVIIFFSAAALGIDPVILFTSFSGFIIGFGFMIGAACSKYVEGLLLIFVRRPYNIGDRIHVDDVNAELPSTGSAGFIVKDVDVYTTTVVYGATNEVATYSNGSLASSRIINAARSPKANLSFNLKFPIDASLEKLRTFKITIEKFVKSKPREWAAFLAFRTTRIEADLGFVEYIVLAQHRESWQNIAAVLESEAKLASFALELSKRLNLQYSSPPLPVDLSVKEGSAVIESARPAEQAQRNSVATAGSVDYAEVARMFDSVEEAES